MVLLSSFLKVSFILTGLDRWKSLPWITFLIRLSYLAWLFTAVFLMFYRRLSGGDTSVGGLVGTASFVCNGSVNIIIILECIFKYRHLKIIDKLETEVDYLIKMKWNIKEVDSKLHYKSMNRNMLLILFIQLLCEALKMWINAISKIQPVFWYTFPISISLRTRYIQIIAIISKLNGRVEIFKESIINTVKMNEPSPYVSDIWQPYKADEYEQLNHCRLIYLRIWEMYKGVNECFGWSILFLFMTSFFDIVCNCYWTFTAVYKGQVFHKYVFNGATSMSLATMVIVLFYYTDTGDNNSRYIGCLISKLVKQPLGNKRYNDLVSEFSVQTLHQRFIITAKEFFSLNLGLLGSMVAAIVTYLIILIQFMFAEKSNKDIKMSSKELKTTTAETLIYLTSLAISSNSSNDDVLRTTFPPNLEGNVTSAVSETLSGNITLS